MTTVAPCIFYESKVKTSKMLKVKLKRVNTGALRKRETLMFETRDRFKRLIHVIDPFTKNAD